jgi:hypothetical protein
MGAPFQWQNPSTSPSYDGQYPYVTSACLGAGNGYWVMVQAYSGGVGYSAGRFPFVWVATDPTGPWTKVTTPGYPGVPPGTNSTTHTQYSRVVAYDGTYFAFATAGSNTGGSGSNQSVIVYGSASSPYSDWSTVTPQALGLPAQYSVFNIRYTNGTWIMTGQGGSSGGAEAWKGWIAYSTTGLFGTWTLVLTSAMGFPGSTTWYVYDCVYSNGYYYVSAYNTGGDQLRYASSLAGPWTDFTAAGTAGLSTGYHYFHYIVSSNDQLLLRSNVGGSNTLRIPDASPPTAWTTISATSAVEYATPPGSVSPYWIANAGIYSSLTGPSIAFAGGGGFDMIVSDGTHTVGATAYGTIQVLNPSSYAGSDIIGTLSDTGSALVIAEETSTGRLAWMHHFDRTNLYDPPGYYGRAGLWPAPYTILSTGDIVVADTAFIYSALDNQFFTKYKADGARISSTRWIQGGDFQCTVMKADSNDNIIAAGKLSTEYSGTKYFYVIKMDSNFTILWQKRFLQVGSYAQEMSSIGIDSDNNIHLGIKGQFGESSRLVKLSGATGALIQGVVLTGHTDKEPTTHFDSSGNVWLTFDGDDDIYKMSSTYSILGRWRTEQQTPPGAWGPTNVFAASLSNDTFYINSFEHVTAYDLTMSHLWTSNTLLDIDLPNLTNNPNVDDSWSGSSSVCATPDGGVIQYSSRNYNDNDYLSSPGTYTGPYLIKRNGTTGAVEWCYMLYQIWPSPEAILDIGFIDYIFFETQPFENNDVIQVHPDGSIMFEFSTFNSIDLVPGPGEAELGYDTHFIVKIRDDGTTRGSVDLPVVYNDPVNEYGHYQYQNKVEYGLRSALNELIPDTSGKIFRATTVTPPTFTTYSPTLTNTMFGSVNPGFTYQARSIDWFMERAATVLPPVLIAEWHLRWASGDA